jgi:hypothetical protein
MNGVLCGVAAVFSALAAVGGAASAAGPAAKPSPRDNPYNVEQLSRVLYLGLQKDADGNVASVTYGWPAPPTDDVMTRLRDLGHVRTLYLRTDSKKVYTTLIRAWPTLRKATLQGAEPDAGMVDAISELPELQELDLTAARLPAEAVRHLTGPATLRSLNLSSSTVADEGLWHVARLKGLRVLDLSHDRVSDAGVRALAGLENLETLILKDTDVDGSRLEALKGLSYLRELDLRKTGIAEESAKPLRAIPGLHILGLRTKKDMLTADDPGCYAALRAGNFRPSRDDLGNVDGLGVAGPGAGTGDWSAQIRGLHSLRLLTVGPAATDAELASLADAPSLRDVHIAGAAITDAGLAALARLPRLRSLTLGGSATSQTRGWRIWGKPRTSSASTSPTPRLGAPGYGTSPG